MRSLRLAATLAVMATPSGAAQVAPPPPAEQLLLVPLSVSTRGDSALSVRIVDLTRERVDRLARYKVRVISKAKICEALQASGFHCDGLMDDQQARQLARFLRADAFGVGVLSRDGSELVAQIRVVDVGGSGFAAAFTVSDRNPGTAEALAEAIAQRLNTVIRAAERARECELQRQRAQFSRALDAARKAFETDSTLAAAHLCVATVYEAQRLSADSVIAAATRALAGDSLNTRALETIARQYQVKGDTANALRYFERLVDADPSNKTIALGLAAQYQVRGDYGATERVLRRVSERFPGDEQVGERLYRVCIAGGNWHCVLEQVDERVRRDTTLLADTATLKVAIGAAQQAPDTQALELYTGAAVRRYPNDPAFLRTRVSAHEWMGRPDSAVALLRRLLQLRLTDVAASLSAAKILIDNAVYDTTGTQGDSVMLQQRRAAFADGIERARPFLATGLASADTVVWINSAVLMLSAGSKLAQAQAYDRAYVWLDTLLTLVAPRSPADTVGPRQQIRVNASFWFGISSVVTAAGPYSRLAQSKSCSEAKAFNDRLKRTRAALELGRRVHEQTVSQMLRYLGQYENAMGSVKQSFKCRNF